MKNLYGYFIVSLLISILCIIIQTDAIQIIRLVSCLLNLVLLKQDKYIVQGLLFHKIVLLLCGVLTQQSESIMQFLFDEWYVELLIENRLQVILWRMFSMVGSLLLVYLKYSNQESISLILTFLLPFMYFLPLSIQHIKNYYQNKQQTNEFQTTPKITTREYLKLKSRIEDMDFMQMDFDANFSVDLNQLIRKISSNQDQQFVLQEISAFNEQVWKLRMNAMPIGICIIGKTQQPKFMNRTLINMIKKNFILQITDDYQSIYKIFMNTIHFRRVDQQGSFDWPQSAMFKHEQKNNDEEAYCLKDLLQKLEDGTLDRYLNDQSEIIELFSIFESPQNQREIFFDCRVLYQERQNIDYMVIIQDFTKQNELSKLEEKNRFKSKIIQSFSHELRTPLNSATIFLRSALNDPSSNQNIKSYYLLPCLSALKLQNHLINDIIDFSQINAKLLDLRFSTFKLQQLIDEVTDQFKFQFEFKSLGLAFEICQPLSLTILIKTDYQRLLQVVTNLIQNAFKFSEKGYVLVKVVALEQNEIEFTIQDEGIGFTRKQLTTIQQLINTEQASVKTQKSTYEWQGFGLIICQMLLKYLSPINRNSISITSDGSDTGSKITFIISNHIAAQTQEQVFRSSNKNIPRMKSMPTLRAEYGLLICIKSRSASKILLSKTGDNEECDLSSVSNREIGNKPHRYQLKHTSIEFLNTSSFVNNKQLSQRFSQKETGTSLTQICCNTILSVDDEVFNQKSLQLLLSQQGLSVDIAFNGRQAIERVLNPTKCSPQCCGYKLILMDCQMPIMDGWKTTKKLIEMMRNQQIRKIPIIGLTAFTSNEDMIKCKEVGMIHILHKPLDIAKFQQILSELRIF